jgi:hypothetical protein
MADYLNQLPPELMWRLAYGKDFDPNIGLEHEGKMYVPRYEDQGGNHERSLVDFASYELGKTNIGDEFAHYGQGGDLSKLDTYKEPTGIEPWKLFLASMGGMALLPGGIGSLLPGASGSSLAGGEGTSSLMGGAGADAIGGGTFNAAVDSQLANAALGSEAFITPAMTGAAMANVPNIVNAGSTLSGLLPSLDTALKVGGTIAGGIAGSKGVESESTTRRQTDPRVDPYLFGDEQTPGLLKLTQQQLARDTSPQAQALWESMKSKGMGLLNSPMAPNGFGLIGRR